MSSQLHVSPRTVSEPMAFTGVEFMRGALYAWLWFLVFSTVAHLPVAGFFVFFVLFTTVPWSMAALFIGSGFAYGLGRCLTRRRSLLLHASLFTVFGACVGLVTTRLAIFSPTSGLNESTSYSIVAVCIAATIAVPLGWWQTASRALQRDRAQPARPVHPIPAQPERDSALRNVLADENPKVSATAPEVTRAQRPRLEVALWLLIPVVLLVAHAAQVLNNFSMVGCEGACDLDLSLGAIGAYPWEIAASVSIAIILAIVLRWRRKTTYWAPFVGVVLVIASVLSTSIFFHVGLAGMHERNSQIEHGDIPAAPPPPDPVGRWGAETEGAPYLQFERDGTLIGADGCNDLIGQWTQDQDGEITLDSHPVTTTVCDGVDTWLSIGRKATITEDFLYIRGAIGSTIGGLQQTR